MPKLIDYPRTTYAGAWELTEVVDDTGGKCSIETAARKLNRKVSGSFKAIIGSAVKFGLVTSKRELLTTTTLFKRIKHAYDKQEEILFHREAFLTPPLFTQLCRKFRSRELPVQMLDVMLIREFAVEEINAQGVAKAFTDGCRMVGLLNEHNIIADIDALTAQQKPRRELSSINPATLAFRNEPTTETEHSITAVPITNIPANDGLSSLFEISASNGNQTHQPTNRTEPRAGTDAVANLFGLLNLNEAPPAVTAEPADAGVAPHESTKTPPPLPVPDTPTARTELPAPSTNRGYQLQISGPGVNTLLSIDDEDDISIAIAVLEKIRRQLKA